MRRPVDLSVWWRENRFYVNHVNITISLSGSVQSHCRVYSGSHNAENRGKISGHSFNCTDEMGGGTFVYI